MHLFQNLIEIYLPVKKLFQFIVLQIRNLCCWLWSCQSLGQSLMFVSVLAKYQMHFKSWVEKSCEVSPLTGGALGQDR